MGKVFVTDPEHPRSALAFVGCFCFYAGEPDRELVSNKPEGFVRDPSKWVIFPRLSYNAHINIEARNVKLSEAPSHGIPAILYDADAIGAKSYLALAKEIIDKNEK